MFTLESVLHSFGVHEQEDAIGVYQIGSRVYGTQTESSDWDFVIVICDESKLEERDHLHLENNKINGGIFKKKTFEKILDDHELWAIMCLFLPLPNKWKETTTYNFQIRFWKLRSSLSKETRYFFNRAKKLWNEDIETAKKNIVHSLRYYQFGIQILQYEKIIDFTSANEIHKTIMEDKEITYEYYKKIYAPKLKTLKTQFVNTLGSKLDENITHVKKHKQHKLDIIDYIQIFGMNSLYRDFSIRAISDPNCNENIILISHANESPEKHFIVKQAQGLVLNSKILQVITK